MATWQLFPRDLKKYPHFDPVISLEDGFALASDPESVAKHRFYPFLLFHKRWTLFAPKGVKGKKKSRPIRFAARADAYIFMRYRHLLATYYERALEQAGLLDSVLAYRRVPLAEGARSKCNIHFAYDAFNTIKSIGDCSVVAIDISKFFESLDHKLLKQQWCKLLGRKRLPPDHQKVFEAITRYSVVEKLAAYERLGHYGAKRETTSGRSIKGYLTPFKDVPKQLCAGHEFQSKIAGGNGEKSLIKTNQKPYGIPQGAPISDLLANLYLFDFDTTVAAWAAEVGGKYFRYSDDILLVVPGDPSVGIALESKVRTHIRNFGRKLKIKEEKSSVFQFSQNGDAQVCDLVKGSKGKAGLEYLGFRFDGRRIYFRNATISNLRRRVAQECKRQANEYARRYPDKDLAALKSLFNYEVLIKKFGRVEDFGENHDDYRKWTFWTYAQRAKKVFGDDGKAILKQLKKHRKLVAYRADEELHYAVVKRAKRKARAAFTLT